MARKGHKREEIYKVALQIIKEKKNGIRYSDLHREIKHRNTIHGTLHKLRQSILEWEEKNVYMPERGLFVWNSQGMGYQQNT